MSTLTITNVNLEELDRQRRALSWIKEHMIPPNQWEALQGVMNMLDTWSDALFTASEILTTEGIEHDPYDLKLDWFGDTCGIRRLSSDMLLYVVQPSRIPQMLLEVKPKEAK